MIFEPLVADLDATIDIVAAHSEIRFYSWGDCACCLPKGTTAATLVDSWIEDKPKDRVQGEGSSKRKADEPQSVGQVLAPTAEPRPGHTAPCGSRSATS